MAYIVTGPLAVAIVGGKRTVLHKGVVVPEGADENRIKHLLAVGLIKEKPTEAEATDPGRGSRGRATTKPTEKAAEADAADKPEK